MVELAQLLEGYELELSEVDLKSISKELTECKGRIQSLTKSYLMSEDPSLATDAHELLSKVDGVTSRGQKQIWRLLRRLGQLLEGSETSSLENEDVWPKGPPPQQAGAAGGDLSFKWTSGGGDHRGLGGIGAGPEERGRGGPPTADNDLAMLLRSLGGAQANNSR